MTINTDAAAILAQLATIAGVRTCDDWHGEIEEAVKRAAKLPALYLVYGGAVFQPKEVLGGPPAIAGHNDQWTVVVCGKDLRAPDAAAPAAYTLIEAVRAVLIEFAVGEGWLWPINETLIFSGGGVMAYALEYTTFQEEEY